MTNPNLTSSTALPPPIKLERRKYGGNMSPEERDRLTRTEVELSIVKEDLREIKESLAKLLTAAAMGRGAWWIILKIGGIGVLIVAAGGWVYEQLHR